MLNFSYQFRRGFNTIRGTTALPGFKSISGKLKEDHFVCICAGIMLLSCPVKEWDTEKVDYVMEKGKSIFAQTEDLSLSDKRILRNILIDKHYFDIVVKKVEISDWKSNKNVEMGK